MGIEEGEKPRSMAQKIFLATKTTKNHIKKCLQSKERDACQGVRGSVQNSKYKGPEISHNT